MTVRSRNIKQLKSEIADLEGEIEAGEETLSTLEDEIVELESELED